MDAGAGRIILLNQDSPVNAPVVTTTAESLSYPQSSGAAAVDAQIKVGSMSSTTLAGATVAISANYASGQDILAFTNQNGITGSWNAGTGVLTLSGTASLAKYQAALRSVTYTDTSDYPTMLPRTVSFVADDGANLSADATRTITLTSPYSLSGTTLTVTGDAGASHHFRGARHVGG